MELAGAGAGAAEGLDTLLTRIMRQQQVDEQARHDQATEALQGRSLDQNDQVRQALADLRNAQIQGIQDKATEAARVRTNEDALINDPATPDNVKQYIKLRRAVPPGEQVPYQLIVPKQTPPKSLQTHFGDIDLTDNGVPKHLKNVPFQVNPVDGSLTFAGQQIDPRNVHGVVSPSMLAAGLQWDPAQGLVINKPAGTAKPVIGPDGQPLQPDLTSSTRTMKEGAQALLPHIKDVSAQADALDKAGLFGPAMSRIRQIASKVGTLDEFYDAVASDPQLSNDERVGRFATSLGLLATGAGRVHGGARGGGSPQMYQHFKDMLSDTGTLNMFKGRLGAVDDFMQGYANMGKPNGSTQPPAADFVWDSATGTLKKPGGV